MGDVHGEQIKMIEYLTQWEIKNDVKLDFVLQVGDFESARNENDLTSMAVPDKYRKLGDFHLFDQQKLTFPWPIYFIGGNHESYGYLEMYPDGHELVKNCHYLGRTGYIDIHGVKIAGLSGIYSSANFDKQRPIIENKKQFKNKLLTYFNSDDINKILDYKNIDILLLHDWPKDINHEGPNYGNPHARLLMNKLKPSYVFCGHIHHPLKTKVDYGVQVTNIDCLSCLSNIEQSVSFYKINLTDNNKIELINL